MRSKKTKEQIRKEKELKKIKWSLINLVIIGMAAFAFFSWIKSDHSKEFLSNQIKEMVNPSKK